MTDKLAEKTVRELIIMAFRQAFHLGKATRGMNNSIMDAPDTQIGFIRLSEHTESAGEKEKNLLCWFLPSKSREYTCTIELTREEYESLFKKELSAIRANSAIFDVSEMD